MATLKYRNPDTNQFEKLDFEDKTYTHIQASALATWDIVHNLGKMPSITIINSANELSFGNIEYIDNNRLRINFSAAISGKAILN